jgi:hypothetical protein
VMSVGGRGFGGAEVVVAVVWALAGTDSRGGRDCDEIDFSD